MIYSLYRKESDMEISKADWSLFKAKIPQWQEAYMNRLNQEYLAILSSDKSPSEKFWALEQRIRRDKGSLGVQIQLRRSEMHWNLFELIQDGAITREDLCDFSRELQAQMDFILSKCPKTHPEEDDE